ncbi:hypothetical protein ACWD3J_38960 [Streptomyces sp. NPDC002755]|uniref:hypothetical protein n=1 Tax=Streptomyces sp. NPDC002884 TaxID=3154544 RepID=UPI0033175BF5
MTAVSDSSEDNRSHPSAGTPQGAIVVDEVLGRFVRGSLPLPGGGCLVDSSFSRRLELEGRTVVLLLDTKDAAEAQRLLPRLRRAVEGSTTLRRRALEAVVLEFSVSPVTEEELGQAQADLLLDTIVVDDGMDVVLHLTDSCGQHVMDGYWPSVRFDAEDQMTDVTIEA